MARQQHDTEGDFLRRSALQWIEIESLVSYSDVPVQQLASMHHLILFVVIFSAANGQQTQYECQGSYNPDNYKGSTRVPTTCREESLDCPRSWKAGVSGGKSTSTPLIDLLFVQCHEGFLCCGYVPIDSKNGEVLGQSGVTVGSGVDLGSKDKPYFTGIVSSSIIAQVEPYLGLKRNDAACAAIERPLDMSCFDAAQLTSAVKDDIVSQVQVYFSTILLLRKNKVQDPIIRSRFVLSAIRTVEY